MYEYPPILTGDALQQIAALRDYLVRQTRNRDNQLTQAAESIKVVQQRSSGVGSGGSDKAARDLKQEAASLKALILKTAEVVESHVDEVSTELHEDYLALSDFGTYRETVDRQIVDTARGTVESYGYGDQIRAAEGQIGGLQEAMTELNGQIRRGLITDPETNETVIGIAISQELRFTGSSVTRDGVTYYELSPGQTLGLYTSTGWQFWINGSKRGWFDSTDGMLHVSQILVESRLQLGEDWLITTTGGFGIRKI